MWQFAWLLVLATVLVIVWLTLRHWDWLSNAGNDLWGWLGSTPSGQDREETNSSTLRNVGVLIAGLFALLIAGWRSWVAGRQAKTAEQDLLNDRYQKGAEMLGNDVLSVRLGGIYALQRLADEHPEQYHIQIMRLFCAFVRFPCAGIGDARTAQAESAPEGEDLKRREDVQAIMEAVAYRKRTSLALEQDLNYKLDLRFANLCDIGIPGGLLSGANLFRANLTNAELMALDLSDSNLSRANLAGARLLTTNVSNAKLRDVENLVQAQLNGALADPERPPSLIGTLDAETGKPLVWRDNLIEDQMKIKVDIL